MIHQKDAYEGGVELRRVQQTSKAQYGTAFWRVGCVIQDGSREHVTLPNQGISGVSCEEQFLSEGAVHADQFAAFVRDGRIKVRKIFF